MLVNKKDEKGIKNRPLQTREAKLIPLLIPFIKRCLKCQDIQAGAECRTELHAEGSKELMINSKD